MEKEGRCSTFVFCLQPERRMLQKHLGLAIQHHQELLLQANAQLQQEEIQLCLELRDIQERSLSAQQRADASMQKVAAEYRQSNAGLQSKISGLEADLKVQSQ